MEVKELAATVYLPFPGLSNEIELTGRRGSLDSFYSILVVSQ